MNNPKTLLSAAIFCLIVCGFALAVPVPEPNNPNLNNDSRVDFVDYAIFANNWQESGTELQGDFDNSGKVDIDDLMIFSWYWLAEYSEYQQCEGADLDKNGIIAFEDLARFAQNWLLSGNGLTGDFDNSNSVDCNDLSVLTDCWLKGSRPEGIWEQFKAALAAGNINEAVSFVSAISRDKYSDIFYVIEPNLPNFVAGMGQMILSSSTPGQVKYEMLYDDGGQTYSFPVTFVKDDDGIWRIYNF